jgi:hypothetical protein
MYSGIDAASCTRYTHRENGVMEASYSGVITMASFTEIRLYVVERLGVASAALIRTDTAVLTLHGDLDVLDYVKINGSPPGAVVVAPEQAKFWHAYAARLACFGVIRAVYLSHDLDAARNFVQRQALLRRRGLL